MAVGVMAGREKEESPVARAEAAAASCVRLEVVTVLASTSTTSSSLSSELRLKNDIGVPRCAFLVSACATRSRARA